METTPAVFQPTPGERLELRATRRNASSLLRDHPAGGDDVLGLAPKQAAGLDVALEVARTGLGIGLSAPIL